MATRAVVVTGVEMMTAVGLSAAETAAATRAGVARFIDSDFRDAKFEPITLAEVPDDGLPDLAEALRAAPGLTYREMRLLRLAALPLRQSLESLSGTASAPALLVALPERDTMRPLDPGAFLRRLAQQTGGGFDVARSDATFRGRAGGLAAIGRAVALLSAGSHDVVIAGGVDSFRDPFVLGELDLERRLKSERNADGFVPGEGACFVVLATRERAAAAGLTPLASVSPVSAGVEGGHLYSEEPYRGEGLAVTVTAVIEAAAEASAAAGPIAEVYCSMNGESHWTKEWGVAFLRNSDAFLPDHRLHHPADCFGDTGAACGPLLVGLAALGIRHGLRRSPCLVYASSDRGARAAAVISRAN